MQPRAGSEVTDLHLAAADGFWKGKGFTNLFMDWAVFAPGVFKDHTAVIAFDCYNFVDLRISAICASAIDKFVTVVFTMPLWFLGLWCKSGDAIR